MRTTRRPAPTIAKTDADAVAGRRYRAHRAAPAARARQVDEEGRGADRHARSVLRRRRSRRAGQDRRVAVRHGADAAHQPRAKHGRAVVAIEPRRLQGGGRCRGRLRARAADDDDGGRHGAGRAGLRHGRGRRRACRRSPRRGGSAPSSPPPTCARRSRSRWPRSAPNSSRSRTRSSSRPRPRAATPRKCRTPTRRSRPRSIAEHVKNQDIVITTALIPGRPAPKLISKAMIESMKPGSIIVDLAVERGGNAELAKPGEIVEHNGVRIFGKLNLPGSVPVNASSLYARNLQAFVEPLIDKENEDARHQLGRRAGQGHADRPRRRHRQCDDRRASRRSGKPAAKREAKGGKP